MQNSSKELLPNVFGGSIQRDVLIAVGADQDVIDLAIERREWDNKVRDIAAKKLEWWNQHEKIPQSVLEEQMEIGEREALLRAIFRA